MSKELELKMQEMFRAVHQREPRNRQEFAQFCEDAFQALRETS